MVVRANPEKKEEKERIRHELFRATLRLASAHGFASLGLREVSREALIAPTSFYRHFEDMEQLGLALIEEKVGPLLADLATQATELAKVDADLPRALAVSLFQAIEADPELFRFMIAERVGGLARFRAAIAAKVARLVRDLGGEPVVAEAFVAILLDAGFKALDGAAEGRDAQLAHAIAQLHLVRGPGR